jgi:phenylacetate-CoA ligase
MPFSEWKHGSNQLNYIIELEKSQWYNREKLEEFQQKKLLALLRHAYENVPYYHRIFNEFGIVNDGTRDLSKFDQIPILTREIMRRHHKGLISKDYKTRKWYYNSTGGSTGEPTRFIQDDIYGKWTSVTKNYYYQDMLDIDEMNVKKVILWGSERDLFKGSIGLKAKVTNLLTNTIFLNGFIMTEEDMERYIKIINAYKPDLIRGYAGLLYELCRYAERKDRTIHTPKIVISAAETLSDVMREKIEAVFGTKLYDYYGTRETAIAGECRYGLMHMFIFNNYVELLDNNNKPVSEGEEGRIIVTNLHNYSMPFIRYEIGDMAVLGPEKCKCGSPLPTLKKVTGRITDHFVKEDGTIIPAEFFIHLIGVVCNKGFIKKFQVIQEDYAKIKILVVLQGDINTYEKKGIEDKIRLVMGKDCNIVWEFVEEIPKTKSGKYLYTKSLVWK